MSFPDDQINELKEICGDVQQCSEGGYEYFYLPLLHLPDKCTPKQIEALLCPVPRDGYTSRLFFSEIIQLGKTLNWNATGVRILERNWHAFSWRIDKSNLRLAQMIATHLEAFR